MATVSNSITYRDQMQRHLPKMMTEKLWMTMRDFPIVIKGFEIRPCYQRIMRRTMPSLRKA